MPTFSCSEESIGTFFLNLDRKIHLNERINQNLEAMAKQLYEYWFIQFDFPNKDGKPYKSSGGEMVWNETLKREIPAGWEVKPLNNGLEIKSGFPFKSDTYKTFPSPCTFSHNCKISVDFPIPGSPAIRTREPSTIPPPRSLSISALCRVILASSVESISDRDRGLDDAPGVLSSCFLETPVTTFSSTIVFHSPHAGQRPIHFGLSFPHDVQNHTVFCLIFGISLLFSMTITSCPAQILPCRGYPHCRYGTSVPSAPYGSRIYRLPPG